jgi:phenylacetate-CoA ligase
MMLPLYPSRLWSRVPPAFRALKALHSGLDWSRSECDRFRDTCVRELVKQTYETVPYYRRAFDQAGVQPHNVRGVSDLLRLPITERSGLQRAPAVDMLASWARNARLITHSTSGSTGQPLLLRRTRFEERVHSGIRLRVFTKYGARVTDHRASLSLGMIDLRGDDMPITARFGLFPRTALNANHSPEEIIADLRRLRPKIITGYANSLARIADHLTPADMAIIRPRFVNSGSEILLPQVRRELSSGFGCPVYNTYGCHEANLLAWECPSTGYLHICDHSVILEVDRGGRPAQAGEDGEVIITALHSYATPVIRYRLNDLVTRGPTPCPCGHPASTIINIQGRALDWFTCPGGLKLHPIVVMNALERVAWVRRFQVTQTSRDELVIRIVPSEFPSSDAVTAGEMAIETSVEHRVRIKIQLVDNLTPPAGSKFKLFVPLPDKLTGK